MASGNQSNESADQNKVDEELSKLLDSSLQEFGKTSTETPEQSQGGSEVNLEALGAAPSFDKEASQRAAAEFQNMLRQLSEMQKVMLDQMKLGGAGADVAQAAAEGGEAATAAAAATNVGPEEAQIAQAFLQNLNFLAEKAQKLQEAGTEDELENAVRELQSDTEYENEFLPFMQGLMSSLLSKETLYPSLKEMSEKYPPWLEENRSKVDAATLQRYEAQLHLIKEACKEFEAEKEDDPDDVKGQRFERMIVIMQQMQACGHPPEDLVGSLPPGWAMDEQSGIPHVVDQEKAAEACSIM